ncbi:flagellar motor protein MotB [Zavarzinia compransoris]|uniref:Chemotaxis protein MotB n=1 Tax=Zavarzinia compransoris TaxID=1264899 RepID=A0A317E8G9_9PROT|nr:flagellar motor protein MotB [Zavarzinia compransoris]PWR23397.1 chemotaxis protein MotB [Zavarzinia compransoris]TDP46028.1 chemotaxis protein MotB [Zavarzinia compransoris]
MANGDNGQAPSIIIKRVKKVAGGHHGGAWKVAYADFVTAMMAFFLLLWLLNATSEAQKQGIADYFDPVSVSETTSGAGGVLGGQSISSDGNRNSGGSPALITRIEPDSATTDAEENDDSQPLSDLGQGSDGNRQRSADGGQQSSALTAPLPGDQNNQSNQSSAAGADQPPPADTRAEAMARAEQQRFKETADALRQALQSSPELQVIASQVLVDITPEGMRIQLVDGRNEAMFQSGSSRMSPKMVELLGKIAAVIGRLPNRIAVAGHTDAAPYRSSTGYTNWELSADRANASRRVLIDAGVKPERVYQISGKAASEPLNPDNPLDPANRRITITLLRESPVLPPGIATVPALP